MESNIKGALAEQKVVLRAMEKGFNVSRPISPARYDLVLDDGQALHRVQVKYADGLVSHSEGSVLVNLRTWNHAEDGKRSKHKTYSAGEVDLVLAYIPKVDKIVKIEPQKFQGKASLVIRYEGAKNGQKKCNSVDDMEW